MVIDFRVLRLHKDWSLRGKEEKYGRRWGYSKKMREGEGRKDLRFNFYGYRILGFDIGPS